MTEDPDDDLFLLCAAMAQAEYIVTQDKHLLKIGRFFNIPIITIEEFFIRENNLFRSWEQGLGIRD